MEPHAFAKEPAFKTAEERSRFVGFVQSLIWATGSFEVLPVAAPGQSGIAFPRPVHPGFIVHSLLGSALKTLECGIEPKCDGQCAHPETCVYGRLMEPRAHGSDSPLARVARAPSGMVLDAPWERWRPGQHLCFGVILLGEMARHAGAVSAALKRAFAAGAGSERWQLTLIDRGWQECSMPVSEPLLAGWDLDAGICRVLMRLLTPLRLVRDKRDLASFDFVSLVRDLSFRLGVWGNHYQGLEWPSPWKFLFEEAAGVRVAASVVKAVRFKRFSGRQNRLIPMRGLLGQLELEGLTPALLALLRAGEICGAGKGASIGLGRIQVTEL